MRKKICGFGVDFLFASYRYHRIIGIIAAARGGRAGGRLRGWPSLLGPSTLHALHPACSAGKKRADADAQTRDRLSYRTARLREVLTFIINRVSFGKAKGLSRRYSTLLRTTRSAATSAFVNMSRARCVLDISAAGIRSDRAHVRDAFMFLRAMCRRSGLIWAKLEWWFGGHPLHEMNQFISRKYFRGPWQDSLAILI
jgi:hypothetical protein